MLVIDRNNLHRATLADSIEPYLANPSNHKRRLATVIFKLEELSG